MLLPYLRDLWANDVLWISILIMTLAQFLKPFIYWLRGESFDWHHISATGGMPSSHSALVSSVATGVGLEQGFDSAPFAIAVAVAMIVTYDAGGVRRQAGEQARAINQIIAELLSGHPLERFHLREVLGHSRAEVAAGILFGVGSMLLWKLVVQ
jgi:acid phosphatase family membrane protein YuiD